MRVQAFVNADVMGGCPTYASPFPGMLRLVPSKNSELELHFNTIADVDLLIEALQATRAQMLAQNEKRRRQP